MNIFKKHKCFNCEKEIKKYEEYMKEREKQREEKSNCQEKCLNDSQCLIDNLDKCLINPQKLRDCASKNNNLQDWENKITERENTIFFNKLKELNIKELNIKL